MPQAPDYLREKFKDDRAAWKVLTKNYTDNKGVIVPRDPMRSALPLENDAIDYLVLEWDYGYQRTLGGL